MSFLIYHREVGTTSGSGKGGDNRGRRRSWRRGSQDDENRQDSQDRKNRDQQKARARDPFPEETYRNSSQRKNHGGFRPDRNRGFERPKWIPPQLSLEPLPVPNCVWCGKPIRDIASAMADKDTGAPVHFDCVIARLTESEQLEKGDVVAYLGGGRFGVVHFNILPGFQGKQADGKSFTIKKVFEWENKENRAEWRSFVSDHYSVT